MSAGRPAKPCDVAYVYLLRCADDSLYCGWTTDVERRVAAHRAGTASRYTRSRRPVEVALVIAVADDPPRFARRPGSSDCRGRPSFA